MSDISTDDYLAELNRSLGAEPAPAPAPEPEPEPGPRGIENISHRHEGIMNWLIANPHKSLKQCANELGYTQSWISTVIHSDLFQARLREKQEIVFGKIVQTIPGKLRSLADVSIEKLTEQVEASTDPRFLLEASKMALANLGFGAPRGPAPGVVNTQNVQQNFYVASPADLEAARARIAGASAGTAPLPPQGDPAVGEATPHLRQSPLDILREGEQRTSPGPLPVPFIPSQSKGA